MGQVLHGSATTTKAVRRAIQHSQESLRSLARRYGVNQKTVAKWKRRSSVADCPTGPKDAKSTVLSPEEEAVIVAFRRHTLLPLDDCLYALQPTIPHLTPSSLHRCLQRHGISQLPKVEGEASVKRKFKPYPIGYFHVDIAEVRTAQGRLYLLVAIDRTSKFAFVELHEKIARWTTADFLRRLIAAIPYKIHTVLTDNGTHFTTPGNAASAAPDIKADLDAGKPVWAHAFEYVCAQADIDHRLTKPKHPWTNGQVERMNRTIKDATVKRYFYETHDELRTHLADFVAAYNFARRLKTLNGLTPYEFICKLWTREPHRFSVNPLQQMPGLNTALSAGHQVIAVDLQGHGGTADINRPLSYEAMADDVAALVRRLGFGGANLMGYSLGGGVALRTAIQHPDVVKRLVVVSTPFKRSGWHKENLEGMAQTNAAAAEYLKQTPLWDLYSKKAPRPEDFPRLLDKMARFLGQDYDWSAGVAALKRPTMVIAGDWDAVRIDHATEMFKLLGGGQRDALWDGSNMTANRFAILPGATHYTIFSDPRLAEIAIPFLDTVG